MMNSKEQQELWNKEEQFWIDTRWKKLCKSKRD